ncbi:MAG TPA: hypothetical protein ENO08_02220 [Candidatus Eisenbacteria bacterium]|uniref:Uncharacterized protein n=1 Tax=Eiseniibacteriota bacterium TaxID=2212470 RepID=A0A7V2AU56_UNCEI|nr:hypothetical protein [Candidatus Eisenbacteria bacterium]
MRRVTGCAFALVLLLAVCATETAAVNIQDIVGGVLGRIYNNWLRDDDGDGIPNCQDDDYVPPADGDGIQYRGGRPDGLLLVNGSKWQRDDDGDGIPNGQDGDYVPPEDCTGNGWMGRH